MSNPFRAIGKAFRAVVKTVKKVALPALAIGAAVLTGGAALGILPGLAGSSGLLASVGIHGALAGALATAGEGALVGMAGSALTGKSLLSGATTGFIAGGVGGALGVIKPASFTVTNGASGAANTIAGSAASLPGAATNEFANPNIVQNIASGKSLGLGSAIGSTPVGATSLTAAQAPATLSSTLSQPIRPVVTAPAVQGPLAAAAAPTPPPLSGAGAAAASSSGGGLFGLGSALTSNPFLLPGLLQGVGSGISASSQIKAQKEQADAEAERIAGNYSGFSGFSGPSAVSTGMGVAAQPRRYRWVIDPVSGQPVQELQ